MTSLHNHHVEQAGFVVLKSPDTPSILVETGFISNPYEERNLSSPVYQDKLAQAIFNGLHQYFREYPPRGTQFR
jgi:N-acetylmuramoyl-L-alanine amidase